MKPEQNVVQTARTYEPERFIVEKDLIYAAKRALTLGVGYTKGVAAKMHAIPVQTYLDDRVLEMVDADIRKMEEALEALGKVV